MPSGKQSYDYVYRQGVRKISWEEFGSLTARLAEMLSRFEPQVIVGIARAGLFPATAMACSLRCEMFPVRITRRVNDVVVYKTPVWKVPVSLEVVGKVVAVVDEIADTGETLAMVADETRARGASQVVTACLVSHRWADPMPDVIVMVSDALIIFPWDREVLIKGSWQPHPEIVAALEAQSTNDQGVALGHSVSMQPEDTEN